MSKYKAWYRPIIVNAVRAYPMLKAAKVEMMRQSVTAGEWSPRGSDVSRSTERAALRALSPREEAIIDAVEAATADMLRCRDGKAVMTIVELVDYRRSHTMQGAAMAAFVSLRSATEKRSRFLYAVGKKLGYLQ